MARLAEPVLWLSALLWAARRLPDGTLEPLLAAAAVFLLLRLCIDTAPNLAVAPRLEADPHDERRIRRALSRVKLATALGCGVGLLGALLAGGRDWPRLELLLGLGAVHGAPVGLLAALASYAVCTPFVWSHRGMPIARPSLGPAAAALLFLLHQPFLAADVASVARAGLIAVAFGNLVIGTLQRFLAAAERMHHPAVLPGSAADVRHAQRLGAGDAEALLRASLAAIPFVALPAWPVVLHAFTRPVTPALLPLLAGFAAALPALLFDARRAPWRFGGAALILAFLLLAARPWLEPADATTFLEAALVLASFPGGHVLLSRGRARALGVALLALPAALGAAASGLLGPVQPWHVLAGLAAATALGAVGCGIAGRTLR